MNVNEAYHTYLKGILSDPFSVHKTSRAGDTIATSGGMMKFDLAAGVPLINTKKLFYRGIIHELVWFMHGPEKDNNLRLDYLIENDCHFWTANVFEFYLQKTKQAYIKNSMEWNNDLEVFGQRLKNDPQFLQEAGIVGRPYGAQWRQWKGSDGKVYDQLAYAFTEIKKKSDSRRLIVETWKTDEISNMALPPCHKTFQFLVMGERLDIIMQQRSADSFLGVPFNIASYGIFGMYAAAYAGLKPGIFTHQLVDTHIYCGNQEKGVWYKKNLDILKEKINAVKEYGDYKEILAWIMKDAPQQNVSAKNDLDHITAVLEQLSRDPYRYPIAQLEVLMDGHKDAKELLDAVCFTDFVVTQYEGNHYPPILRKMPA